MPVIVGSLMVSYRGNDWTKTNLPGSADFGEDAVTFSPRWRLSRFFRPITLNRDEITKIESDGWLSRRFGHGFTFHTNPEAERITFYVYGRKKVAELDRLVQAFLERQPLG